MGKINWMETLKWDDNQLEDLRLAGYSYIRQGKYDIALSFFEALCVLDPENAYDAQTLGAIYLQMNNPAKALKCFDQALKLDTDHSATLLNVTKAFFMLGRHEEGLRLAKILTEDANLAVSNMAKALILAYS